MYYGFPGLWHWEIAYRAPERFRLSLRTTGETQHYVFDGEQLDSWLGETLLASDGGRDAAAHRSIGRWLAVSSGAALEDPSRVRVEVAGDAELGGDDLAHRIALRFRDAGDRYLLGFDAAGRLRAAAGPIEIPGIGAGRLTARFDDFRKIAGHPVAFAASYRLNDEPFYDERVLRFVPGRAVLDPRALPSPADDERRSGEERDDVEGQKEASRSPGDA